MPAPDATRVAAIAAAEPVFGPPNSEEAYAARAPNESNRIEL
jgi:hypothetical protein